MELVKEVISYGGPGVVYGWLLCWFFMSKRYMDKKAVQDEKLTEAITELSTVIKIGVLHHDE